MGAIKRSALCAGAFLSFVVASVPAWPAGIVGSHVGQVASAKVISEASATTDVTTPRIENRAEAAELTFGLSRPIAIQSFVMTHPDRVILDLPQVAFRIDPQAGVLDKHGRYRGGLISSFRFGLLAPNRSRVIVDLSGPSRIVAASVRTTDGSTRLVLSLARTDRASFEAQARLHEQAEALNNLASAPAPIGTLTVPKSPDAGDRATIVIDAGHGGPDLGAVVKGTIEKDVTLAFAKMLAGKLEATGRYNVVMTRATDVFVPLGDRVAIARHAGAALMVSVHADTVPEASDVSGATVYTVSDKASDAYAAKVAAKENDADLSAGIAGQADVADVNDILFDLTRQETRAYSHVFARTLVNYWKVAGRLNKNPQRAAGFIVLRAPDVPSVLLELGYLSNPVDAAALATDDWRDKATASMTEAIGSYFDGKHGLLRTVSEAALPEHQASAALPAK